MANFEEELKKLEAVIKSLSNFALFGKKIEVSGEENFVKEGPNIIIGNHIGSFKDVAILFKIVPRPIFFTANKMIFNKEEFNFLVRKHLHRHMKKFGLFLNVLLTPIKSLFVQYISSNIAKVGTIPVDMYGRKAEAIDQCVEFLKKGRAIITLQGRGRIDDKDPNPYIKRFRRGASIMAFQLYERERISVPVTPLAFYGTHLPFPIPAKIKVHVGRPMYIRDYLKGEATETIERFRDALEARVNSLFFESLRA
jgi:1-acyl-sn-glycerol-3-phosphate acyltransferase